jgi:hypothetical protein
MKLTLVLFAVAAAILLAGTRTVPADPTPLSDKVGSDCTFKGKKLYGKVKVVDAFADFEVKKVDAFADLHVKKVDAFADSCGKWKFVDAFPDFEVKWVDAFPDFEIKMVDAFPGVP